MNLIGDLRDDYLICFD